MTDANRMKSQSTENVPAKKKRKVSEISNDETEDEKTTASGTTLDLQEDRSFSTLSGKVSEKTLNAVKDMGLTDMSEIQAKAIPHLLEGKNFIGSAKTGTGKTLSFLIPAVELINKKNFDQQAGTGCIIMNPTRELAIQTFEVLQKLLKYHHYTCALIIGGIDTDSRKTEAQKLKTGVSIIVATPGRLLGHVERRNFTYENLQCLVIDEADHILNFQEMKQILQVLPENRQTVLLTATMTDKVTKLSESIFKEEPVYIGVDDDKDEATVEGLEQGYIVCPTDKRFLLLYTFLKRNEKQKIMVFFNSSMSTKYHCELFNYISTPVMSIHGKQTQTERTETFSQFRKVKFGTLLCTNVAARGLDIPNVDWIVQYDPPDKPEEYIHRVGRTARAGGEGKALLFLRQEELGMTYYLQKARVPLHRYNIEDIKLPESLQSEIEKLISNQKYLRLSAIEGFKAFIQAYRCHHLKHIFNIATLNLKAVAKSFGFTKQPAVDLDIGVFKAKKRRQMLREYGHLMNLK